MTSFKGKFRHTEAGGSLIGEGDCELVIEGESFLLVPSSGSPLACDLGEVNQCIPGEYEISLKLYAGDTILLTHFGKVFSTLSQTILEAYRARLVQCLLLEDLEEVERFDGWAQLDTHGTAVSSRVEIRLYRSSFAVLPETAAGFSWRYADIDGVDFEETGYTLTIRSDSDRLVLTRLAKRTGELMQRLRNGISAVSEKGAHVISSLFPFLSPDQFTRVAGIFKEGRAVPVRSLIEIDSRIENALAANAVDSSLKEYLEFLQGISVAEEAYTGFKEIRTEETELENGEEAPPEPAGGPGETAGNSILHWFLFPLKTAGHPAVAANAVAWEAASATGRATYFFRLVPPGEVSLLKDPGRSREAIAKAVRRLNRAMVTLNFRREPIYLPDDVLLMQKKYRRYAIACRRIPVLQELRASFLGRALHTSPEAWQKQVRAIVSGL